MQSSSDIGSAQLLGTKVPSGHSNQKLPLLSLLQHSKHFPVTLVWPGHAQRQPDMSSPCSELPIYPTLTWEEGDYSQGLGLWCQEDKERMWVRMQYFPWGMGCPCHKPRNRKSWNQVSYLLSKTLPHPKTSLLGCLGWEPTCFTVWLKAPPGEWHLKHLSQQHSAKFLSKYRQIPPWAFSLFV